MLSLRCRMQLCTQHSAALDSRACSSVVPHPMCAQGKPHKAYTHCLPSTHTIAQDRVALSQQAPVGFEQTGRGVLSTWVVGGLYWHLCPTPAGA